VKVNAEQAYVLHTRPFRESSSLVDIFSRQFGRLRVIARVSRSGKKIRTLTPFTKLAVNWTGRSELKTLTQYETIGRPLFLQGDKLFLGLYINELICRIVPESDPHEMLFDRYGLLLATLAESDDVEPLLRIFEFALLEELGYGLNLINDANDGHAIQATEYYLFRSEDGLHRYRGSPVEASEAIFLGGHLQSIAAQDYQHKEVRRAAKQISRMALQLHLKGQPLRSRELFMNSRG